jgi:hypothetical protein
LANCTRKKLLKTLAINPMPCNRKLIVAGPDLGRGAMGSLRIAVVLMAFVSAAYADLVPTGLLSFDILIPGMPGSPGLNGFTVANTRYPTLDGFALPPDFPVSTSVMFLSSTLTLNTGSTPQVFNVNGPVATASFDKPRTMTVTSGGVVYVVEGGVRQQDQKNRRRDRVEAVEKPTGL